jgi:hypothetical protein
MLSQTQIEKLQLYARFICAVSDWLLPKIITLFLLGTLSVAWLLFYTLQFWTWHYAWLIPLVVLSMPLWVLAVWCLLLWDLSDLPQAIADLNQGVSGIKKRIKTGETLEAVPVVMAIQTRKFPAMLKELWEMVQGVDVVRSVIGHAIFLANPLSWVLLIASVGMIIIYNMMAFGVGVWYLLT